MGALAPTQLNVNPSRHTHPSERRKERREERKWTAEEERKRRRSCPRRATAPVSRCLAASSSMESRRRCRSATSRHRNHRPHCAASAMGEAEKSARRERDRWESVRAGREKPVMPPSPRPAAAREPHAAFADRNLPAVAGKYRRRRRRSSSRRCCLGWLPGLSPNRFSNLRYFVLIKVFSFSGSGRRSFRRVIFIFCLFDIILYYLSFNFFLAFISSNFCKMDRSFDM
ncbi:uncharacterized protein DS421_14g486910 [Arachis hypogaea]|nr:uncharacterized protein DS421_14g486910 [Arachis hypogaea]